MRYVNGSVTVYYGATDDAAEFTDLLQWAGDAGAWCGAGAAG